MCWSCDHYLLLIRIADADKTRQFSAYYDMSTPTPQPGASPSDIESLFDAFSRLKIESTLASTGALDGESQ